MQIVKVGNYEVGQGHPLMLMAGPCVLEGYERSLMIGQRTKAICDKLGIPYVIFLGEDEIARGECSVKELRTGEQVSLPVDGAIAHIRAGIAALASGSVIIEK